MTTYNNNHHRNTPFLTYQNKIYSFDYGGAEVYDPQTKVWSSGVTVPGNIGEGECGLLYKDSVFIFGGGGNVRYVQKYNFTTGMWTFPFTLNNGIFFSNCYRGVDYKGRQNKPPFHIQIFCEDGATHWSCLELAYLWLMAGPGLQMFP